MNKIIKITSLFISISFLLASCSNNSVVKKGGSPKYTEQTTLVDKTAEDEGRIDALSQTQHDKRFIGMLEAHNKVRAKHNVPPLKWSKKLEDYSMQWAKQLSKNKQCDMYHRSGNTPFGENLYRSTAIIWTDGRREINPVTITDVVKAWTDEEKWYDYETNSCQPGAQCGHYTQAVWRSTTEVGCAMQVCGDKSQTWVCSYNPPGNYIGLRPY